MSAVDPKLEALLKDMESLGVSPKQLNRDGKTVEETIRERLSMSSVDVIQASLDFKPYAMFGPDGNAVMVVAREVRSRTRNADTITIYPQIFHTEVSKVTASQKLVAFDADQRRPIFTAEFDNILKAGKWIEKNSRAFIAWRQEIIEVHGDLEVVYTQDVGSSLNRLNMFMAWLIEVMNQGTNQDNTVIAEIKAKGEEIIANAGTDSIAVPMTDDVRMIRDVMAMSPIPVKAMPWWCHGRVSRHGEAGVNVSAPTVDATDFMAIVARTKTYEDIGLDLSKPVFDDARVTTSDGRTVTAEQLHRESINSYELEKLDAGKAVMQ